MVICKELRANDAAIWDLAWNPKGDKIVSGTDDKLAIVWDALSGVKILELRGHLHNVRSVSWSPNGEQIASGSFDTTAIIWDAGTGEILFELKGHSVSVSIVAWNSGGDRILSSAWDSTVIVWNTQIGLKISQLNSCSNWVNSVAWCPGDDRIALGTGRAGSSGQVTIWDARTGELALELEGHSNSVTKVSEQSPLQSPPLLLNPASSKRNTNAPRRSRGARAGTCSPRRRATTPSASGLCIN